VDLNGASVAPDTARTTFGQRRDDGVANLAEEASGNVAAHKAAIGLRDDIEPRPRELVGIIYCNPSRTGRIKSQSSHQAPGYRHSDCSLPGRLTGDREHGYSRRFTGGALDCQNYAWPNLAAFSLSSCLFVSPQKTMIYDLTDLRRILGRHATFYLRGR